MMSFDNIAILNIHSIANQSIIWGYKDEATKMMEFCII